MGRVGNRSSATDSGCAFGSAQQAALVESNRHPAIWKLEAALKCRSRKKGRYASPVHMIKPTQSGDRACNRRRGGQRAIPQLDDHRENRFSETVSERLGKPVKTEGKPK
jgi:hypothetical protein